MSDLTNQNLKLEKYHQTWSLVDLNFQRDFLSSPQIKILPGCNTNVFHEEKRRDGIQDLCFLVSQGVGSCLTILFRESLSSSLFLVFLLILLFLGCFLLFLSLFCCFWACFAACCFWACFCLCFCWNPLSTKRLKNKNRHPVCRREGMIYENVKNELHVFITRFYWYPRAKSDRDKYKKGNDYVYDCVIVEFTKNYSDTGRPKRDWG